MLKEIMEKGFTINCGLACMLRDRMGILDKYEKITVNCGTLITSSEISAKLAEKGGVINTGSTHVQDVKGEILQLEQGCVIDGTEDFADMFVLMTGDVIVRGNGAKSFATAEGGVVTGTLFYPESSELTGLSKIKGDRRAYPGEAHIVLGDFDMEQLLVNLPTGKNHIWVSGKVTAIDEQTAANAQAKGLKITCDNLLTYESINGEYGGLIQASQKMLVPDGYEIITGDLNLSSAMIALYGTKLYVMGELMLAEKDAACLEELEAIIVKGRATLATSCAKTFRKVGKAEDYFIYEGNLRKINGFEQFTHAQLQAMLASGIKNTLTVNGCLMFADDVTAEDIDAIAILSYNGSVFAPGAAMGALSAKIRNANGFMGDLAEIQKLTGLTLEELIQQVTGGGGSCVNTGSYILV